MKIFGGSKNELQLIKSMMATGSSKSKPPLMNQRQSGNIHQANSLRSDGFIKTSAFEQLGKIGASKNDSEIKVEKALIELNEIRNDIMFMKKEDKFNQADSAYALQNQAGTTSSSFNPMTPHLSKNQSGLRDTRPSDFFVEGSLMGNIDSMSKDQLKERLLVAEALMKKLFNRNKDVELYHKQKV